MLNNRSITTLFLDIGGVLLNNGWGHESRHLAAKFFKFDFREMESRHMLTFDLYESGKLTLDEYLNEIVFYIPRNFTSESFRKFIFAQSEVYQDMIDLMTRLKKDLALKIVIVSNEARELNAYRIQKFNLNKLADIFISSSFVHLRKPDPDIFKLALDISQVDAQRVLYIDDQPLFLRVAKRFGIKAVHHVDYESTHKKLELSGLKPACHKETF